MADERPDARFSRADLLWLLGCALLALTLRLAYQASYRAHVSVDTRVQKDLDTQTFDRWAHGIAAGDLLSRERYSPTDHWWARRIADSDEWTRWLPDATFHQSPLYPYLVATLYLVIGEGEPVVPTLQAFLGAVTAALTFCLARRFGGRRVAILAGLLVATFAPSVFYSQFLLRVGLLEAITIAFLLALDRLTRSGGWRLASGVGLLAGAAVLAKPILVFLFPLALLHLGVAGSGERLRRTVLPLAAGFVLVLVPVLGRNLIIGAPTLSLTTRGPAAFINGNASASDGKEWFPERNRSLLLDRQAKRILNEVGWNRTAVIAKTLKTHDGIGSYLSLLGRKARAFLAADEVPNNVSFPLVTPLIPWLGWLPDFRWVGALGCLGLLSSFMAWRRRMHLVLFVLGFFAVTVAFFVIGRFRVPVVPALAVLGAVGLGELITAFRSRPVLSGAGVVVLGLMLWVVWPTGNPPSLAAAKYDLAFRTAEEGRYWISARNLDMARSTFQRALSLYDEVAKAPLDPDAPNLSIAARSQTGRIYLEQFQSYDEALAIFRGVLRDLGDEGNEETLRGQLNTHASMGTVYRVRSEQVAGYGRDVEIAYREYEQAVAAGQRAVRLGILNEDIIQTTAWVYCHLARLDLQPREDEASARRNYEAALELKPRYAPALYGLGRLWVLDAERENDAATRARLPEALRYLRRSLKADPPPDQPAIIEDLIRRGEALLEG